MKHRPSKDISRLLEQMERDLIAIEEGVRLDVQPALAEVQDDISRVLARFTSRTRKALDEPMTRKDYREIVAAMRRERAGDILLMAPLFVGGLEKTLGKALRKGSTSAGVIAAEHVSAETEALGLGGVRVDTASTLSLGDKLLAGRVEDISYKVARDSYRDSRLVLARGIGRTTLADLRDGEVVTDITERIARRLERVIVTETTNSYNEHKLIAMGDWSRRNQVLILKRWDAFRDRRTCDLCREMDGNTIPINEDFAGGVHNPPLHSRCRCICVTWAETPRTRERDIPYTPEPTTAEPAGLTAAIVGRRN